VPVDYAEEEIGGHLLNPRENNIVVG